MTMCAILGPDGIAFPTVEREAPRQRLHPLPHFRRSLPRWRCWSAPSAISAPTSRISASPNPRVVTAGEPNRMPLGFIGGLVSNGIAFLLTVMRARSSACSASLPAQSLGEHIQQHHVRIGAARDHPEPGVHQCLCHGARIGHHLLLIGRRTRAAWPPGSRPPWPPAREPAARPACPGTRSYRFPCRTFPAPESCRRAVRAASCAWSWSRCPHTRKGWDGRPPPPGRKCAPCPPGIPRPPGPRSVGSARNR